VAALREKLQARIQPFLEPGEQVQQVFVAQSGPNPNLMFLTYLVMFFNKYWVVAVTDRAVLLLRASRWQPAAPKELAARLPRQTQIGPVSGALWSRTSLPGDKPIWVHRRFYGDVRAADGPIGFTT
jgi:hypothetical protein